MSGDTAAARHFYDDAAQYYQDALRVRSIASADQYRISEKLGHALFFGGDPEKANNWFEQALRGYISEAEMSTRAVTLLLRMAQQLWLDSKTKMALPLITQAIEIANGTGDAKAYPGKRANIAMAQYLALLARYADAEPFLLAAAPLDEHDAPELRTLYFNNSAIQAAASGRAQDAFAFFDRAVACANEQSDGYLTTLVLDDRALWAISLGNAEIAKASREAALALARRHHIAWRVPYLYLRFAAQLLHTGQFAAAYDYLNDALSYHVQLPVLTSLLACVGIPLALRYKDDATLERVSSPEAVDLAFRSGEEPRIAGVSAAFAEYYASSGREGEALRLLHRAVNLVHHADQCWDLFVAIARFGSLQDAGRTRSLLARRTALPTPAAAQATVLLCEAFWSYRNGHQHNAHADALSACRMFEDLRWNRYAALARAFAKEISGGSDQPKTVVERAALTAREQQVTALVLQGYTNRRIAAALAISEHTVESHMSSIMNRLNIRSRWQLFDLFAESGM